MIGFSPARVGVVAALATALSTVVVPLAPAYASATPTISTVPAVTHVGRTITITGSGLEDTNTVSLNGTALTSVTAVDAGHVTAVVPSGASSGLIALTTGSSGSASATTSTTVAPPPVVTGLAGAVADRAAVISWTGAGTGPTVVRDVTGLSGTLTPTDGTTIPVLGSQARDTGFTNTATRDYAVWASDADGTLSDAAAVVSVIPQPAVATTLTLTPPYTSAAWGTVLTLSGTLKRSVLGLGGHTVDLWGGTVGQPEVLLRHLTTATDGSYHTTVMPARSTSYSVRFAADTFSQAATSPQVVVHVLARVSAAFAPPTILRGQTSTLRGQVLPRIAAAVLVVQQRVGTTWQTTTHIRTASDGTYRLPLVLGVGAHGYRVVLPARPGLAQAVSPQAVLRVEPRNLVDGMSGSDVLGLQQLLTRLHYDTGRIDGHYGYDLHHAVMTFQKVERLPVTGSWGNAERLRATHPTAWRVRFPGSGRAVEIDVTRQVLVLSQGGIVQRIIDVSTGSGKVYYQDGQRNIAHTPRGHYAIYYKINGIRISKLGELYKPSYFFQGYAVHGSASVPAYPASHGCVRITNPNADRIFPLLTVHTPVTVYDE